MVAAMAMERVEGAEGGWDWRERISASRVVIRVWAAAMRWRRSGLDIVGDLEGVVRVGR